MIICFGIDLDHYTSQLKVGTLTANYYKGTQIISLPGSGFVDSSLFILRKADLPFISTLPIKESTIPTYSLKKVGDSINLYASVVDFATASKELLTEFKDEKSEDELKKSVLLTISLSLEIKWRKNIQMIQLTEYSEYRQSGLPDTVADVKPFLK